MKKQPLPKYMKTGTHDRILTKAEIKARFDQETASVYSQKDPVHLPEYSTALSLFNHLSCLKEAGFAHTDVLWKKFNFAVYCGKASQG